MEDRTPLYNSRIINTYLEYLQKFYPDIDTDSLLDYANITRLELEEHGHFLTQQQTNRFHEILAQKSENPNISREVGRYVTSAEAFGTIKTQILGLLNQVTMYELAGKMSSYLTRHITSTTKRLGPNKIEFISVPQKGSHEKPFQCENRMGSLESLAQLHTHKYADIEHPECIHRGDGHCRYIITWEQTPAMRWKNIRNYVFFMCTFIFFASLLVLPLAIWGVLTAACVVAVTFASVYSELIEKKELLKTIEAQSMAAHDLVDQTNRQYSNALLIQELGQATSTVMDIQVLCSLTMDILNRHLDFDYGKILLKDESKDTLIYMAGYGYIPEENEILKNTLYHLSNSDNEDIILQTFTQQKPCLINDISSIQNTLSPNSLQSYKQFGATSFICVPIVYERESLGILFAYNKSEKRTLTLIDQNLLLGIASQIAVSITNARSFQKIQESEQHYRTIFESTSNPTIIMEQDTTISLANTPFEKLSGYSREEIQNKKSWTEFIAPEDLEKMKEQHRLRRIDPPAAKRNYEFRFQDKHDNIKDIFLTVDMIPNTNKSVASLLDITERKLSEKALRKSEERYRLLAENVHDVIWVMDLNFRYTYISPSVKSLKGYSVAEALSMTLEEIYTADSYQIVKDMITEEFTLISAEGLRPKRSRTFEVEQICKDGSTIWTEVTASVLCNEEDEPTGILGITRDISERKRSEQEKQRLESQLQHAQKMEAIGTLAGGIAHDFNNLLMGIQGNASLLLADIDSSHAHFERLKNIEQYVKGGADLTRQLLGFARGGKYEVVPTNINELIQKSSELFGRTRKELTIHRKYQDEAWTVEVDQGQMEQVLLNLYVNAWQAMSSGGEISLETENIMLHKKFCKPYNLKAGKYVKISVTDNGVGMDEKTQKRIFDPFFTTKEMGRGTGMGLASAYGIVMNHGGIINVSSRLGVGTTFNIYLPASDKDVKEDKEPIQKMLKGCETIMLIDDEDLILDIGKQLLERLGYTVVVAKGGVQAVDIYQEKHSQIDLVILDMIMPDLSGGETFDEMKKINPEVKVLLSSGYSLESQAKDILNRGCKGFIQKPFGIKSLSQKIRDVFK